MNALSQARQAYSAVSAPIRTPRSIEYEALSKITSRIHAAAKKGKPAFSDLAEALHDNTRMWTLFASGVADSANSLSPQLRAQLFYLAEFTRAHTGKVLRREASVKPLLEINAAVMRGLRGGAT